MTRTPSLVRRVVVGKAVGFAVGLVGFFMLPYFWAEAGLALRFGVLFWYATVGAVIGMAGVWTRHPVLDVPMPWYVRAPLIGAWMNFVLMLFAGPIFHAMLVSTFGADAGALTSPYWMILEGALVGALIGGLATMIGGEGKAAAAA